jgi:hypothetical protein
LTSAQLASGYTIDNPLEIPISGRFVIFESLPTSIYVRFNEKEEPSVLVSVRKKLYTPFYRLFIHFDPINTTEELSFYISDDFDISDVNVMFNNKDLVMYNTPLGTGTTPYTSAGMAIFEFSKVTFCFINDVDGTLDIQFSGDNTNWDKVQSYAITGGVTQTDVIDVVNKYVRAVFTKKTPSDNQTYMRLALRARVS